MGVDDAVVRKAKFMENEEKAVKKDKEPAQGEDTGYAVDKHE